MRRKRFNLILILIIIILVSSKLEASTWRVYQTDYFRVFCPKGYDYQAQEVLYYLEKYRESIMDLAGNEGDFKTHVVIQDIGLNSNGYADATRYKIGIYTNTPSTYSRMDGIENSQSWLRMLSLHEFVHLAQMTNSSGGIGQVSQLLGNHFSPNVHTPLWIKEGIAIYGESQASSFEGRLNSPYYNALIAAKSSEDQISSLEGITYKEDDYFYGALFLDYLAKEYGEDSSAKLFYEHSYNQWAPYYGMLLPSIGIDKAASIVYEKDFLELFEDWKEYEERRFKDWAISGEVVAKADGGKVSNLIAHEESLYYFKDKVINPAPFSRKRVTSLVEYDLESGEERVLKEFARSKNATLQVVGAKLYFSLNEVESGFANTDSSGRGLIGVLYSYDLKNGEVREIFSDEFKDYHILEDGSLIYTKDDKSKFGSQIWKYSLKGKEYLGLVDQSISEITGYEGDLIVVSKENLGSWGISSLNLDELTLKPLIRSNYVEKFIKVEGDYLYFTASYGGSYGLYRYSLTEEDIKKLSSGSYAADGIAFEGEIYFVGVGPRGERIYRDNIKPKDFPLEAREEVDSFGFDSIEGVKEGGATLKSLSYLFKPYIRFPLLMGEDALGFNSYYLNYLGDFEFNFTTKALMPLVISYDNYVVANKDDKERKSDIKLLYPLYNSLEDGLSRVDLRYRSDLDTSFLGGTILFASSYQEFSIDIEGDLKERDIDLDLVYKHLFDSSNLGLRIRMEENPPYYEGLKSIYDNDESVDRIYFSRANYMHRLGERRIGLWNPNLFIGDIYGNLFIDYARGGGERLVAPGYELLFEAGAAFEADILFKLGLSKTLSEEGLNFNYGWQIIF